MKEIAKQIIQKEAWRRFPYRECEQGSVEDMNEENREDFIHENQWLIDALPESEWVSVEELPSENGKYVVCGYRKGDRTKLHTWIADFYDRKFQYPDRKIWYYNTNRIKLPHHL